MSGSHSTTTNTLGVERRPSFAPSTPKRLSTSDASSAMKNRRVDDESEIEKKYSFGEVLGQGAFGVVKEVTNRQTHQQLAMKIVQKDKVILSGHYRIAWPSQASQIQMCFCKFTRSLFLIMSHAHT